MEGARPSDAPSQGQAEAVPSIRKLDENVVNRIAAGEVIQVCYRSQGGEEWQPQPSAVVPRTCACLAGYATLCAASDCRSRRILACWASVCS